MFENPSKRGKTFGVGREVINFKRFNKKNYKYQ